MFIRIPLSAALGAASMTGVIASGIILVLTKKYQKKLKKVMRLTDIVTPALVVFERVLSGTLKNGVIDEEEFNTIQTLHLETLNELTGVDCRMEARAQIPSRKKPIGRDKRAKEKSRNKSLVASFLCYFVCHFRNG